MNVEIFVKPILWISSSKKDLMAMSEGVVTDFGYGLYQAQIGKHPDIAKTLSGFGGARKIKTMAKQREENTEYEVSTGNIFADLGLDQPEELLARAKLLNSVSTLIKNSGLSQKDVAEKLGITQPKVSLLVTGQLSAFSTDTLIHYLSILGCEVEIKVKKPRTRREIFRHKGHIAVC